jgi:aromatic ring-opening dioxygenase catalytic subunit (LigB family)
MAGFLRALPSQMPEGPRALLVVSAHWETDVVTVSTAERPGVFHDWFGEGRRLPPELADLDWPAPGAPDVAAEVVAALTAAGIEVAEDPERGFDHGVFVPMKVAYPDAHVPTVALSIRADLDPEAHLEIGRALAPLRERGVAIIGSGFSFHNLKLSPEEAPAASRRFSDWLAETVALEPSARAERLARWTEAPDARACHVREEHLIPLMVVAGAAGDDRGRTVYDEELRIGVRITGHAFG